MENRLLGVAPTKGVASFRHLDNLRFSPKYVRPNSVFWIPYEEEVKKSYLLN